MNRTRVFIALVASVALLSGCSRLQPEDAEASPPPEPPASGPLAVSGSAVGSQSFGTDADVVVTAVTDRLGGPDSSDGPQRYVRIPGHQGWYEVADDPISPSWRHRFTSSTCWGDLCLVFGGRDADTLALRGWTLMRLRGASDVDVRLKRSGIRLGDTWRKLHAAYPDTQGGGAEGASLAVHDTPWPGIFDGVAEWRLSGQWDYTHPHRVPPRAKVTRLSGGEGPEPGCC